MSAIYYCWFDTEYTDNDYDKAELLEVALLVTDEALGPIPSPAQGIPAELLTAEGFTAPISLPEQSHISSFVLENQEALLERCRREGRSVAEVDRHLASYMSQLAPLVEDKKVRPVLAGNTIHADYYLARKYLPEFVKGLNFRVFDVTAFKLEWLHFYGRPRFNKNDPSLVREFFPGKSLVDGGKHDALYDVQASIAELNFYRSQMRLVDGPAHRGS